MDDGDNGKPFAKPVVGGISILQSKLNGVIATATLAVESFNAKVRANEETKYIRKATAVSLSR